MLSIKSANKWDQMVFKLSCIINFFFVKALYKDFTLVLVKQKNWEMEGMVYNINKKPKKAFLSLGAKKAFERFHMALH